MPLKTAPSVTSPLARIAGWRGVAVALGSVFLAACSAVTGPGGSAVSPATQTAAAAVAVSAPVQPEGSSGTNSKPGWSYRTQAVAAANPLATEAGQLILRKGGSAIDAAIAVQMVLTLVEPQSSGIGGGAFLVYHDGQQVLAYDGRETAPAAATPSLFLNAQGQPIPFEQAVVGGRSVGTPGAVAMLAMAHQRHGRLPWAELFAPAIQLAREGFRVSPRMATLLAADPHLKRDPAAAAYFYDEQGRPWPQGHLLTNPELAAVLQQIAEQGPTALTQGAVAESIVRAVRNHPTNPGGLTLADLQDYRPKVRAPLCFEHPTPERKVRICGMPPPSSGTLAIGQILGTLVRTPAPAMALQGGLPSADWLHLYVEASRLAFADRALYVGDPDFVTPPAGQWSSLIDGRYLAQRAALIDTRPEGKAMPAANAGQPQGVQSSWAPAPSQPEYGTSHISIVDARGHALAMTTTIEAGWGSRLIVNRGQGLRGGFLLNNQLTDFSFAPSVDGKPVANRVEAGKRPRSSMSPVLVFDAASGALLASAGSPGGALIIHFTAKTLWGTLQWGMHPQQAIDLPNFASLGGPVVLEAGRFPVSTVQALQARGHTVNQPAMPSGLQALVRRDGVWLGGADPRREGIVAGD